MSLPEQLPRAKPTDEGPFLIEVHPDWRRDYGYSRWWKPEAKGFTDLLDEAGRYSRDFCDQLPVNDSTYPVCVPPLPIFGLSTRLGRVQAAWWLRDRGAPQDVMPYEQRRAYGCALIGDDKCDVEALAALVERYREAP